MPKSFTRDELMVAVCREAFKGEFPIDITTTSLGATTGLTGVFGQLAYTTAGATFRAVMKGRGLADFGGS